MKTPEFFFGQAETWVPLAHHLQLVSEVGASCGIELF